MSIIIGHQNQWRFLKKTVELNKISHAYLFCGQEKLGKKKLAFEFVKLLNCQEKTKLKPCQVCRSCQDIEKKQLPDLTIIEPEKKEIQISQIRNLTQILSLKPYSSHFKIAIIDQAHLMNHEAQNAFLKTLEEPKNNVILFLITEYPDMLLQTIYSRCQIIKFFPVKTKEIENYLEKQNFPTDKIQKIIDVSLNKPGLVIDFVTNLQKLKNQEKIISDLIKILKSDLILRFQYIKNLTIDEDKKMILEIWLNYFRKLFLSAINSKNREYIKLKKILTIIQKIIFLTSTTNVNFRLALEILVLNF